jgi:hypothetical protein
MASRKKMAEREIEKLGHNCGTGSFRYLCLKITILSCQRCPVFISVDEMNHL